MAFCTECGSKIEETTKFCPNCGAKIIGITSNKVSGNLEKGVVKGLKKEISNNFKKQQSKNPSIKNDANSSVENESEILSEEIKEQSKEIKNSGAKKHILLYLIANILLFIFSANSDETTGVIFYSVIIFIIYFVRRNKEKPINWLLKILLALQFILIISFLITVAQEEFYSILSQGIFALLAASILWLLFKGNKK